ncbi:hypothetical protein KC342_g18226, partial [Hortaea werneckii]
NKSKPFYFSPLPPLAPTPVAADDDNPKLATDPALAAGVLPTPFSGPDISTGIPFPAPGFSSPTCSPAATVVIVVVVIVVVVIVVVGVGGGITTSFLRLTSQTVSRPSTSRISNAPYVDGISRTNKSCTRASMRRSMLKRSLAW